ncbi:hypothetical protein JCM9957A_44020 [Kineosporia succinea]
MIVRWRGHAMAFFSVLENGPGIDDGHVGEAVAVIVTSRPCCVWTAGPIAEPILTGRFRWIWQETVAFGQESRALVRPGGGL